MSNNRHGHGQRAAREYFTLGEHTIGSRHFRFRYDGRTYLILEQEPEAEEIQQYMDDAWDCFEDPDVPRNGYYAQTCRKSVDAFKFFGYFLAEQELRRRMEEIYAGA